MALTLEFEREKETKNTIRFQELENGDGPKVVGTLYLQKYAVKKLGNPEKLRVTLEVC